MKILFADDGPENRLIASMCFRGTEYVLEAVENGQVAVDRFRAGSYVLVLLDLNMPLMDGLEAARRMRAHEAQTGARRTPILGLSATDCPDDIAGLIASGCDEVVPKPIERSSLLATVRRFVGAPPGS